MVASSTGRLRQRRPSARRWQGGPKVSSPDVEKDALDATVEELSTSTGSTLTGNPGDVSDLRRSTPSPIRCSRQCSASATVLIKQRRRRRPVGDGVGVHIQRLEVGLTASTCLAWCMASRLRPADDRQRAPGYVVNTSSGDERPSPPCAGRVLRRQQVGGGSPRVPRPPSWRSRAPTSAPPVLRRARAARHGTVDGRPQPPGGAGWERPRTTKPMTVAGDAGERQRRVATSCRSAAGRGWPETCSRAIHVGRVLHLPRRLERSAQKLHERADRFGRGENPTAGSHTLG